MVGARRRRRRRIATLHANSLSRIGDDIGGLKDDRKVGVETPCNKSMANDTLTAKLDISMDAVADEVYNSASEFISSGLIYLEMKLLEGGKKAGADEEVEEATKTIEPLCERVRAHLNTALDGQVDLFQCWAESNALSIPTGIGKHLALSRDKKSQTVYENPRADLPSISQASINPEATERACQLADEKLEELSKKLLAAKYKLAQLSKEENALMSVAQDADNSMYKVRLKMQHAFEVEGCMDSSRTAFLTKTRDNLRQLVEIQSLAEELLESDALVELDKEGDEIAAVEELQQKSAVAVHSNMRQNISTRDDISDLEVLSKRLKENG